MKIQHDGNGSPFIEWEQFGGNFKRAWIQRKGSSDTDWAGLGGI